MFGNHPCDELMKKANSDWINWFRNTPLSDLCEQIASVPLCFQPGEHFLYGFSIDVLGRVIEVVSGLTLDVFLEENIFKPLDMRSTGFRIGEMRDKLPSCFEVDAKKAGYKISEREERFSKSDAVLLSGGGDNISMNNTKLITDTETEIVLSLCDIHK